MNRPTGAPAAADTTATRFERTVASCSTDLEFQDHDGFDQEIGTKAFDELHTGDRERNSRLPAQHEATSIESLHYKLENSIQQPGPENHVQRHRAIDDFPGNFNDISIPYSASLLR